MLAICLCFAVSALAQGPGTSACREAQLAAQQAAGDYDPSVYRNYGEWVKTAAAAANPYLYSGQIDAECHSCIVNQFARHIPIAEQEPCGPAGDVKNLRGPQVTECDGPLVGTVSFAPGTGGLDFAVNFTSGPPNATLEIFWVCTEVPNGCHGAACGYISLGTVTTDGSGVGTFNTTLAGGNPYPGMYVHVDIQDLGTSEWYTHLGGDEIYPSTTTSSLRAPSTPGDPTRDR